MKVHKKDWGPGYRFFKCGECGCKWKSKTRDCSSPSGETCPGTISFDLIDGEE